MDTITFTRKELFDLGWNEPLSRLAKKYKISDRRRAEERQEQIEKEFKESQDKEAHAFKKLFLQAICLHQANIIRAYIQTVELNTIKNGNLTEEYNNWKTWAEQKVSWYGPLVNGTDPCSMIITKQTFSRNC
jgi:hypothetical protein